VDAHVLHLSAVSGLLGDLVVQGPDDRIEAALRRLGLESSDRAPLRSR